MMSTLQKLSSLLYVNDALASRGKSEQAVLSVLSDLVSDYAVV